HVEHFARGHANELALGMLDLVMQAAQNAAARARMVVLHEIRGDARFGKRAAVPAFEKKTARVLEHPGLDDQHVRNRRRQRSHHGAGGSSRRRSRYRPYPFFAIVAPSFWSCAASM